MTYGSGTEEELQVQLNEWAAAGYLEILKPLATCAEIEPCIRLISFILPNANRDK
jgi:hypothetical protein